MQQQNETRNNTYSTIIFACFGGFSNTGIITGYASINAVKELKLDQVCIGCLSALSQGIQSVIEKAKKAERIIAVDGCPSRCAQKEIEKQGRIVNRSIVLTQDIGMKKSSFTEVFQGGSPDIFDDIEESDVEAGTNKIIETMLGK